jgi:alkanesulfonate monooxygenase SsuD/methylene tetrahydromethanopterin reductase-like flavin-dependent oxidoreductase (luciferase family)
VPELEGRGRRAEELGFDVLWNVDTVVDPDRPRSTMFDGPATLAVMAARTAAIRIGTLVTSLYFRSPVTAAKAAVTVDHLSVGASRSRSASGIPPRARAPQA